MPVNDLAPASIDSLLRAALRGQTPAWPWAGGIAVQAVLDRIALHGTAALLHACVPPLPWPREVMDALRHTAVANAMWELRHQQVLAGALAALDAAHAAPILIKGTALAYGLYPDPAQRQRADTDLLIPEGAQAAADDALQSAGFTRLAGAPSLQATYSLTASDGSVHWLDVHFRINNSPLLAALFSYAELRATATPLPRLCGTARGADPVQAMLIACMHRATHRHNPYHVQGSAHHEPDRLIWLYDLHLLAQAFTPSDWDRFLQAANAKGLAGTCAEGLEHARACFGTPVPAAVLDASTQARSQPASVYLAAGPARQRWMDLVALGTAARRWHWISDLVFPPADYMRQKYAQGGWLPWLYLRRAAGGTAKRLLRKASR